ncbi:MAG: 4-(cytidine 5'-diphospho)-2-C-methyl-D-erythritol kinase [Kiritimatiellae bacterium]|nr:4-(cytidine 5'-diphospho)-2-C-methyl-D-erythritol kinase [Kiritimatiellia bacterium]
MNASDEITIEAHAKVNLTLEVLGVRPDGYHDLRSIVMPVSLSDTITLTRTPATFSLALTTVNGISATQIGPVEKNLAMRAAQLMQSRYNVQSGVRIRICKRIPIGGGMGGGSSDAAGVIRGLNELWGLRRPDEELAALGAELGSDVPALVLGGAVLMEGRGERVHRLALDGPVRGFDLVIANPGVHCSTPEIFSRWKSGLTTPPKMVQNMTFSIRASDVRRAAGLLYNDLEAAVFERYPTIARLSETLRLAGCLGVLLSGSGASVFGLVRDRAQGEEICRRLDADGVWNVLAHTCPMV